MGDQEEFFEEKLKNIKKMGLTRELRELAVEFIEKSGKYRYSYNFEWLGLPIIQFPQDIVAIQEIIWSSKPDLIIETGVARGGSLILSASILELIGGNGEVLGIDVDIRNHNRKAIESHTLNRRIQLLEGSSVDSEVIRQVSEMAATKNRIMVMLDSMHTHDHVYKELVNYSQFVSKECYLIVFDTSIEFMPENYFPNRPWKKGDNPKTAVDQFLELYDDFVVDEEINNKLLISTAQRGYLKRIK